MSTGFRSRLARTHPCVFASPFIREQIDPRVQEAWKGRWGKGAPFGELRRLFRERHCRTLNPYGSESCPYSEESCGLAFKQAVDVSLDKSGASLGYYRAVCLSGGAKRADEKPLARELGGAGGSRPDPRPTPSVVKVGDGSTVSRLESREEDALRRRLSRPTRLGDLLGADHAGARDARLRPDGGEG